MVPIQPSAATLRRGAAVCGKSKIAGFQAQLFETLPSGVGVRALVLPPFKDLIGLNAVWKR